MKTIIVWLAYWKYKYRISANNINVKIIFPYNSSDENNDEGWWNKFGDRIKPFTKDEVLVGNQFWSFLTINN